MAISILDSKEVNLSTGTETYTPAAGTNRLVVLVAAGEAVFASRYLTGITLGGVSFETAIEQTDLTRWERGGVFFIREANIPVGASLALVDTWEGTHEGLRGWIYTIDGVDQTSPVAATEIDLLTTSQATVAQSLAVSDGGCIFTVMGNDGTDPDFDAVSTNTNSDVTTFVEETENDSGLNHGYGNMRALVSGVTSPASLTLYLNGTVSNQDFVASASFASASPTYTITSIDGDNNVQAGQPNVDIIMTATTGVTVSTLGGEALTINGVT